MSDRIVSVGTMIKQLEGLKPDDLTGWERRFVEDMGQITISGFSTSRLSDRQVEKIEAIWRKHFA